MKILFFRLGAIGDTLLTTPAVRKARELFPEAEIHYLAGEAAAPVLENNPHINRLFVMEQKKHFLPREFNILFVMGFLIKNFSKTEYDYFIDFESSYFSFYVSLFIHAGRKIGHIIRKKSRAMYNRFYDTRVDYEDNGRYAALRHIALVRELGSFGGADTKMALNLTEAEKKQGRDFYENNGLAAGQKRVLFCVSSMWKTKMWPEQHWIKLAGLISRSGNDRAIVVLRAPADREGFIGELGKIQNVKIMPLGSLRALASVLLYGDVLVSNDGAVRHMANALGVKTISIFGPTSDTGWAYADENNVVLKPPVDCRPCYKKDCPEDLDCMAMISPELVMENLEKLI
jgi:heptosyltransferase-1